MLKKTVLSIAVLVLILTSLLVSPAYTQTIVIPPQFKNHSGFPAESIFICTLLPNGARIQALYPASDLIAGTIGGFSIRTFDGFPSVGPFVVPNITVTMSTTNVQALSNTYADNIGPDVQTVFSGDLNVGFIPACNNSPCPFNIPITFQTPFDYDPSEGNLLLDMIVPSCMGGTPFILVDSTPDIDAIFALASNATEGSPGFWSITQISYLERPRPIPVLSEWSAIAMVAGFALIGLFVARRRKIIF